MPIPPQSRSGLSSPADLGRLELRNVAKFLVFDRVSRESLIKKSELFESIRATLNIRQDTLNIALRELVAEGRLAFALAGSGVQVVSMPNFDEAQRGGFEDEPGRTMARERQ
jgi:hypothetical protein